LGLTKALDSYLIFKDQASGLEFIRNCQELHNQGLYIELNAYQYHVFLNMRVVQDDEWHQYAQLASYLEGRGVPSIDEALKEIFLQPIHSAYRELVNKGYFEWLYSHRSPVTGITDEITEETVESADVTLETILTETREKLVELLTEARVFAQGDGDPAVLTDSICHELATALTLPAFEQHSSIFATAELTGAWDYLQASPGGKLSLSEAGYDIWGSLFSWIFTHRLGCLMESETSSLQDCFRISRTWIDEWLLGKVIARALQDTGLDEGAAWRAVDVVRLLTEHASWFNIESNEALTALSVLQSLLKDSHAQSFIKSNRYQGILWYNREAFDEMLWWLFAICLVQVSAGIQDKAEPETVKRAQQELGAAYLLIQKLASAQEISEYKVEKLLAAVAG